MKTEVVKDILEWAMSDGESQLTQKTGYEKYLGKNVFIRSVTHHYTGHVTDVDSMTLTLSDAAWIPEDGRFHESMADSENFEEVEPYKTPPTINFYAILDICEIDSLPRSVK